MHASAMTVWAGQCNCRKLNEADAFLAPVECLPYGLSAFSTMLTEFRTLSLPLLERGLSRIASKAYSDQTSQQD